MQVQLVDVLETVYVSGVEVGMVAIRETDYYMSIDRLFIAPAYRTADVAQHVSDLVWAKALEKRKPVNLHVTFTSNTRHFWETEGYVVSEATAVGFNMVRRIPVH
jgi:hypothetical protein